MSEKWKSYIAGLEAAHGAINLDRVNEIFVPYFRSGRRIMVELPHGERVTGKVTCEGGKRPVLVLQERTVSATAPLPLTKRTKLVGVRTGRGYRAPD